MNSSLAVRLYALALRAYPRAFQKRYAEEMLRVFSESWRDAKSAGAMATFRCVLTTAFDLGRSLLREARFPFNLKAALAACAFGAYATHVDRHASEVQATLLALLAGGALIGLMCPKRAWFNALLLGCWMPATYLILYTADPQPAVGFSSAHPYASRLLIAGPSLVASFIGTYTGVLLGGAIRRMGRLRARGRS